MPRSHRIIRGEEEDPDDDLCAGLAFITNYFRFPDPWKTSRRRHRLIRLSCKLVQNYVYSQSIESESKQTRGRRREPITNSIVNSVSRSLVSRVKLTRQRINCITRGHKHFLCCLTPSSPPFHSNISASHVLDKRLGATCLLPTVAPSITGSGCGWWWLMFWYKTRREESRAQ